MSGEFSPIAYVLAAGVPYKPVFITATIEGANLNITWSMPYNGASLITSAKVKLAQSDGTTYTEALTNCNGADNTVFDSR